MQIIEKIKQFTKPLQGRLLPSNVGLFILYFVVLHLLVNHLFFEEIAALTDKYLIKYFWDIFKGKYSIYFDLLALIVSIVASYAIFSKFWKNYLFISLSIYIAWTAIFLYLSLWDCGLWHIKPIYSFNTITYLDAVDILLMIGFSLILFPRWSFVFKVKEIINILFKNTLIKQEMLFVVGYWVCVCSINYIWDSLLQSYIYYVILFFEVTAFLALTYLFFGVTAFFASTHNRVYGILNELLEYFIDNTILFLYIKGNKLNSNSNFFIEDKFNADLLGRKMIADSLADKLIAQEFSESFTVGIIGEWGAGKSQFMSYMRDKIKQNGEIICFDFSPWTQIHKDKLVVGKHFFEEFGKAYRTYSSALDRELKAFQEKLIDKAPDFHWTGWIVQFFKHIGLGEWFQLDIDRNQINESLQKINRKTVIFIDDFDRLQVEEVVEVLKVIRTTTNFWNTVYIIGVDKTKLEIPLRDRLHLPANYLDKFIQLEVHLTLIENRTLWDVFNNLLTPFLQNNQFITYDDELKGIPDDIFIDFFGKAMGNIRGVKKFFNMLSFDVSSWDLMELELDFFDFMLVSIIKFVDVQEYRKLQVSESEVVKNDHLYSIATHNKGLLDFINTYKNNKESKFYAIAEVWSRRQDKFHVRSIHAIKDAYFYEPSVLRTLKDGVKELFKSKKLRAVLEKWEQLSPDSKRRIFNDLSKIKAFKFVDLTNARFLEFYYSAYSFFNPFSNLFFGEKKEITANQLRGLSLDDPAEIEIYKDLLDFIKKTKNLEVLYAAIVKVQSKGYAKDIFNAQRNVMEHFLSIATNANIENMITIINAFFEKNEKNWESKQPTQQDNDFFQKIIEYIAQKTTPDMLDVFFFENKVLKFPACFRVIAKYKGITPFSLLEEMLNKRGIQDIFYQNIQELKQFDPDIINDTWDDEKPYKL